MNEFWCYVEFQGGDSDSLSRLCAAFEKMKEDIENGEALEGEYLSFFKENELTSFWWPDQSHADEIQARWGNVPIRIAAHSPHPQNDWDFYSMLEVISQCDYVLGEIKSTESSTHQLTFGPRGFPYGGTASLERFVSAFGFEIVAVEDGTGRVEAPQPQPPENQESDSKKRPWWRFWQ